MRVALKTYWIHHWEKGEAVAIEAQPVMDAATYAQGLTWQEYVATVKVNADGFHRSYESFTLDPGDAEWFRSFVARKGGVVRVAVIAEDWCPDVVRGLPVAVRLAEAAGMDCRIFPRGQHLELMGRYLWRHEYQAIPVMIFLTDGFRELGHWTERPSIAYRQLAELADEVEGLGEEERARVGQERRAAWHGLWQRETVRELRELLYRAM